MGKIIKVEGFSAFLEKLEELKGNPALFLLFSGSKDAQTGKLISCKKSGWYFEQFPFKFI